LQESPSTSIREEGQGGRDIQGISESLAVDGKKAQNIEEQVLPLTNERFLVPEMLFHPADLGGLLRLLSSRLFGINDKQDRRSLSIKKMEHNPVIFEEQTLADLCGSRHRKHAWNVVLKWSMPSMSSVPRLDRCQPSGTC
jgi:hypothetical protein